MNYFYDYFVLKKVRDPKGNNKRFKWFRKRKKIRKSKEIKIRMFDEDRKMHLTATFRAV